MTSPDRLRVAAAQYPLDRVPSMDAWRAKMSEWIGSGAASGAELLVFPEYGLIELAAVAGDATLRDLAATLSAAAGASAAAIDHIAELARRHRVHVLAPSGPARTPSGYVNRAHLVAPSGAVAAQDKLIVTPFERTWGITPGTDATVVQTSLGRIGIAICYDSEFPLIVRAMRDAGADLILIPSCTEHLSGFHRVRSAAQARALENQIATVMSPTVGDAPWSQAVDRNTGAAGIFVPPDISLSANGVVAEGVVDQPGWVVADIDFAALRRVRDSGEMRNDADWSLQKGAPVLTATSVRLE